MEQQECCVLGICCDDRHRRDELAMKLQADLLATGVHINDLLARAVANAIRDAYDLVPKGMIQPLIDLVAAEAREYPYHS